MSDINLINAPGIQHQYQKKEVKLNDESKNSHLKLNNNDINESNETNKIYSFLSVAMIMLIILFFSLNNADFNHFNEENKSISYLLKMINENQNNIELESINLIDNKVKILFNCISENKMYQKLSLLNNYNYNAKGYNAKGYYFLSIDESWNKQKNNNWDINKLKNLIKNFKGIESDYFNNKLIIVSDYDNLISIVELFENDNILNSFLFQVNVMRNSNKTYYKYIIQEL